MVGGIMAGPSLAPAPAARRCRNRPPALRPATRRWPARRPGARDAADRRRAAPRARSSPGSSGGRHVWLGGLGRIGVAGRRVLEAHQEAVGEALVQTFRAVVGAPFDLLHMWDLGGERLEALRAVRLLGGGGFGLETNEHDMPDHGISLWSGRGAAMHRTRSAAFSLIITDGALVLELTSRGMTELSQMRRPSMPRTRSCGSTTEAASPPMRQVPTGW